MTRMYQYILLAGAILVILPLQTVHSGIRCENDIISLDETKLEVMAKLKRCGEVMEKESYVKETTYSKGQDKTKTQILIDQWFIRVKERGNYYCYPLEFQDGKLTRIGDWSRCN